RESPLGRLHALRVLSTLGGATVADLQGALRDPDEAVRELAVQMATDLAKKSAAPTEIWERLVAMASDPAPLVRLQVAFSLGSLSNAEVLPGLAELACHNAADPWIGAAVLTSHAASFEGRYFLDALTRDSSFLQTPVGSEFLLRLAKVAASQPK